MAIPSVVQGTVEFAGKVFELDSPRGSTWLESVTSFRFEPTGASKPYTVRKESGKGGDYWYGYRKVAGKLHKKYVGKSSELSTAKLEEIAEALNVPPEPRLQKITQSVTDSVAQSVTDTVADDRLTALELQVQALQQSLEALRGELPGKSDAGDSPELPIVTDTELQTRLGNLETGNAELRRQLENSDHLIRTLKTDVQKLRSQLATAEQNASEWQEENSDLLAQLKTQREEIEFLEGVNEGLNDQVHGEHGLYSEIQNLESQLASRPEQIAAPIAIELPEAADLLNQLKGRRKKSRADLADINAILRLLAAENGSNPV
ncbi:hypothetical protein QUB70_29950 [Microcoleus sp. A003_D6]|uniref:hypothetical protein n=1 Tax=Microcoleus sp. A003_D6 TaxID=3055266 RepID=UPI002FD346B9